MLIRQARRTAHAQCCAVAVMAKASSPGRTKTRLSPPFTPDEAAQLNTLFLADIADNVLRAAETADVACYMAFGPPEAADFFRALVPREIGLLEAWVPDFGRCLSDTVDALLTLGHGAACVLNADSPTLPTAILIDAARALSGPRDVVVLGPSHDGGYYLLGMKQAHRRLFEHIDWSTDRVLRQTRERVAELGLELVCLPTWYDVDDAASAQILLHETLDGIDFAPGLAPYPAARTYDWLRRRARMAGLAVGNPA